MKIALGLLRYGLLAWMGLLLHSTAQARVFDLNDEHVAGYFTLTDSNSTLGQSAFKDEADMSTTYDKSVSSMYTGEFGLLYTTSAINFRFGFEVFAPQSLKTVTATNASGTQTYTLNSTYTVYAPKIGLEMNLHKTTAFRSFAFAYAGSASVSYKNDYTILNYPGMSNGSVEAKGSSALYGGGIGIEGHMSDATTIMFELGYRQLQVNSLQYSQATTTFQGAQAAGAQVLEANGSPRTLNFSGAYLGLGFRFYL